MRASKKGRVIRQNRKMWAAWRRVMGLQEEVDLDHAENTTGSSRK